MKKYNSGNTNNFKKRNRLYEVKENNKGIHIMYSNNKIQPFRDQNRSKMLMLFNDSIPNELPIKKSYGINYKSESPKYLSNNNKRKGGQKVSEKDISTKIDFNMFEYFCYEYFCYCWKKKYKTNIDIFDFGVNFYKSQMSIINIFNVIFLTQTMITNILNDKKHNYFDQITEIPIIS